MTDDSSRASRKGGRAKGPPSHAPTFEQTGRPTTGRVARVIRGSSYGFIRVADERDVFFHRSDVDGSFNDLAVGDAVTCEVIEDRVSGVRAVRVRKRTR